MNTYAIQLLLHFQSTSSHETRFDAFITDLKVVAEKHGILFDDYQSMRLSADDYQIRACDTCGHLTVNRQDIADGDENMLPDFWFFVRRGSVSAKSALCDLCEPTGTTD